MVVVIQRNGETTAWLTHLAGRLNGHTAGSSAIQPNGRFNVGSYRCLGVQSIRVGIFSGL